MKKLLGVIIICAFGFLSAQTVRAESGREIVSMRDLWSKTLRNPSGTYTSRISPRPIHYVDENGAWKEIDTTILPVHSQSCDFANETNLWKVTFPEKSSAFKAVTRTGYFVSGGICEMSFIPKGGGEDVSVYFRGGRTDETTADGNRLVRKNIYPYVDIAYEIEQGQVHQKVMFTDIEKLLAEHGLSREGTLVIKAEFKTAGTGSDERPNDLYVNGESLARTENVTSLSPISVNGRHDGSSVRWNGTMLSKGQNVKEKQSIERTVRRNTADTFFIEIPIALDSFLENTISLETDILLTSYDTGNSNGASKAAQADMSVYTHTQKSVYHNIDWNTYGSTTTNYVGKRYDDFLDKTYVHRNYVRWNTSSIPGSCVIVNAAFNLDLLGFNNAIVLGCYPMATDPVVNFDNPEALFTDCGNGTAYDTFSVNNSSWDAIFEENTSFNSDLKDRLSSDWMAVGLKAQSESTEGNWIELSSVPRLDIEYIPNPWEITGPATIDRNLTTPGDVNIRSGGTLTIYSNEVTFSGNLYVAGTLDVSSGAVLKFAASKGLDIDGTMNAGGCTFTKSSGSNWQGINANSGSDVNISTGITIEYAECGFGALSNDAVIAGSTTSTIRYCNTGVIVFGCTPSFDKVKLENNTTRGIWIAYAGASPWFVNTTIQNSPKGIEVDANGWGVLMGCVLRNLSTTCLEFKNDGGMNEAFGSTDIYPGTKAIDNPSDATVNFQECYWGPGVPNPQTLFTRPSLVTYLPYSATPYNHGAPKTAAPSGEKSSLDFALELELKHDYEGALTAYCNTMADSRLLSEKRTAVGRILALIESNRVVFTYDNLRTIIEKELVVENAGWYRDSLEFILCGILVREGRYKEAVDAYHEKLDNDSAGFKKAYVYSSISEIYSNNLNDKIMAIEYADKAKALNPGSLLLRYVYASAGIKYDPSEYEDKFMDEFGDFKPAPEPEEEAKAETAREFVSISPNPVNPVTTITYSIASPSHVRLDVYTLTGQKVTTLVNNSMSAGTHAVTFDGAALASGIYIYRFESGNFRKTGKMLLVK